MRQGISVKSERINPWFKPWFNTLLHTQLIATLRNVIFFFIQIHYSIKVLGDLLVTSQTWNSHHVVISLIPINSQSCFKNNLSTLHHNHNRIKIGCACTPHAHEYWNYQSEYILIVYIFLSAGYPSINCTIC